MGLAVSTQKKPIRETYLAKGVVDLVFCQIHRCRAEVLSRLLPTFRRRCPKAARFAHGGACQSLSPGSVLRPDRPALLLASSEFRPFFEMTASTPDNPAAISCIPKSIAGLRGRG